jgi:hypothetical protein
VPNTEIKQAVTIEITTTIELTYGDIAGFVAMKYAHLFSKDVDTDVTVKFRIPSGGDYSGCELEISKDNPIIVTVTQRTVQHKIAEKHN